MYRGFQYLLLFLFCFLLGQPLEAQSLEGKDIIMGNHQGVYFFSSQIIKKNGKLKAAKQDYLTGDIAILDTLCVEKEIGEYGLIVSKEGRQYYITCEEPFFNTHRIGSFAYVDCSAIDSLNAKYAGRSLIARNGNEYHLGAINFITPDNPSFNHIEAGFTSTSNSSQNYDQKIIIHASLFPRNAKVSAARDAFVRGVDEISFIDKNTLESIRNSRWPLSLIDSLRQNYVKDSVTLTRPISKDRYSLTPYSGKKPFQKYDRCLVDSLMLRLETRTEYDPHREMTPDDIWYEYYFRLNEGLNTCLLPIDEFSSYVMSKEQYAAYQDSLRLDKERRDSLYLFETEEWIKRQNELNKFEMQLQEIFISMYGEEDGLNVWWGRIRFGYTEEMCKNAYRHHGMYREKNHVDTPLGFARAIHFVNEDTILYFIDDHLIGIVIYGKKRWSDVLF